MSKRKSRNENKENEEVAAKKVKNNSSEARALRDINNNIIEQNRNETESDDTEEEESELSDDEKIEQIQLIKKSLKEKKSSGSPSVGGEAHELNPKINLNVKNFGDIQLPLNENQAEELIKICKKAPFGHKLETLYDPAVRDTFQLEPHEIKIKNKDWDKNLNKLVDRVAKELGCKGKVTANLYKLLLYKKGCHFKKHRDTEKEKGMFGTLVIQLPSIYTGGELVFSSKKSRKIFDFATPLAKDSNKIFYAAHYADVEHEILEVKSGYRLALVYNLCWLKGNAVNNFSNDDIASALDKLNRSCEPIALFLDHKYTENSFLTYGLGALKGVDNDRYCLLKNASDRLPSHKQLNFFVMCATLELVSEDPDAEYLDMLADRLGFPSENIYIYGSGEDFESDMSQSDSNTTDETESDMPEPEEYEHNLEILNFYDSNGNAYGNADVNLDLEDFYEIIDLNKPLDHVVDIRDKTSWGDFVDQEHSGWTGNEGATITTLYRKYFLVFMPKHDEIETLSYISNKLAAKNFLDSINLERVSKNDAHFVDNFKSLVNILRDSSQNKKNLGAEQYGKMLNILLKLDDVNLVNKFLYGALTGYSANYVEILARITVKFGYEKIKKYLHYYLQPVKCRNFQFVCSLFKHLIDLNEKGLARMFFNDLIKPLLFNHQLFKETVSQNETIQYKTTNVTKCVHYTHFLMVILYFIDSPDYDEMMRKFLEMVALTLDRSLYSELIENISMRVKNYRTNNYILALIKNHLKWLEEKCKTFMLFSWCMPNASIPEHPKVEEFLKSDKEKIRYFNFDSVVDARRFANNYGGIKNGYSAQMSAGGRGKNSFVIISKTKELHNKKLGELSKIRSSIKKINDLNLNL